MGLNHTESIWRKCEKPKHTASSRTYRHSNNRLDVVLCYLQVLRRLTFITTLVSCSTLNTRQNRDYLAFTFSTSIKPSKLP